MLTLFRQSDIIPNNIDLSQKVQDTMAIVQHNACTPMHLVNLILLQDVKYIPCMYTFWKRKKNTDRSIVVDVGHLDGVDVGVIPRVSKVKVGDPDLKVVQDLRLVIQRPTGLYATWRGQGEGVVGIASCGNRNTGHTLLEQARGKLSVPLI